MLIYTNNTKKSEWDKILKEAKPYLDKLNQQVEVREVHWGKIPTVINNGKKEIDFNFLKSMKPNKGFFMFHESDFDQEGIHGSYWYNTGISYIERKLSARSKKYKEFKYDVARTLVHELLHYEAETRGIEDETHYYQEEEDNLMAFVDKIIEPKDPLRELYLKLIPLLKKLLGNLKEEMIKCNDFDYVLHHSATLRDYTRRETIESKFDGSYKGFDFYHYIILPNETINRNRPPHKRGTVDICVVGEFSTEKPTQYQIDDFLRITNGEYITHNEAGLRGIATKSSCPEKLTDYIKVNN